MSEEIQVALLNEMQTLRQAILAGGCSTSVVKVFASSLYAIEDVHFLINCIADQPAQTARRCATAAYYSGGLSGYGDVLAPRFADGEFCSGFIGGAYTLQSQAITWRDSTALRALKAYADNDEDAADVLSEAQSALGDGLYSSMLTGQYDASYLVQNLKNSGAETPRRFIIWMLKQFTVRDVAVLLESKLDDPLLRLSASYVLHNFCRRPFGASHFQSLAENAVVEPDVDIPRCMNTMALVAIEENDLSAIEAATSIGRGIVSDERLERFESWCRASINPGFLGPDDDYPDLTLP